jgi:hypothetical protein
MNERPSAPSSTASQGDGDELGIPWEAGEEDYPFAALPGEAALEYFQRWLDDAGYARIERGGARYLHETDVTNVINHITADVSLLRARLDQFGDRVVTSADHAATVEGIERAVAQLNDALAIIRDGDQQKR